MTRNQSFWTQFFYRIRALFFLQLTAGLFFSICSLQDIQGSDVLLGPANQGETVSDSSIPNDNSPNDNNPGDNNPGEQRPNIILINLDDADRDMFRPEVLQERFPTIHSIANRGIRLTNFHVSSPLCAPSRASLFRGQYAHALGYRTNNPLSPKSRGFGKELPRFFERFYDDDLGLWMKNAGYHTALVGKHINYLDIPRRTPAGWDDYYRSHGSRYYQTTRFTNRYRAEGSWEETPAGEYRTYVEADDVVRIIGEQASSEKPLFLYFAPFGPHSEGRSPGGMIDAADDQLWLDIVDQTTPDFDEEDNSDKPIAYRQLPRMSVETMQWIDETYRDRMLSMKAVDRAIERVVQAVDDAGQLDDTYFFVTSDNGFSLGHHRVFGKGTSLTRSANVPLFVCGPGIAPAQSANHLLSQIDLAPTLMEIAGSDPHDFFDGKSFLPVLQDPENNEEQSWRSYVLVENWDGIQFRGQKVDTTFCQLRLYDSTYTEWADGSREFYDLASDPLELENAYSSLADHQKQDLAERLRMARVDLAEPLATVENPFSIHSLIDGNPFILRGLAEDSTGVARVDLVIRKQPVGEYWNGESWQTERAVLPTQLANGAGIQTEWSYAFLPPEPTNQSERYSLIPRAYSLDRRYTRKVVIKTMKYDSSAPETSIDQIVFPGDGSAQIIGRAEDNIQVSNVRLHLIKQSSKQFYNGTEWVDQNQFQVLLTDENNEWVCTTPQLEPGKYEVRARAYDSVGNWDRDQAVQRFVIE